MRRCEKDENINEGGTKRTGRCGIFIVVESGSRRLSALGLHCLVSVAVFLGLTRSRLRP